MTTIHAVKMNAVHRQEHRVLQNAMLIIWNKNIPIKKTRLVSNMSSVLITKTWWRLDASFNLVTIVSGNGLSPVRRQTIIWINTDSHLFRISGISYLEPEIAQVIEIISFGIQGSTYLTKSMPWLLLPWPRKKQSHQQAWYWQRDFISF